MRLEIASATFWCATLSIAMGQNGAGDLNSRSFATVSYFERGRYEATFTSGALFSPFIADQGRPHINYTVTELQLGYMLGGLEKPSWLRGNFEVLGQGFGDAVFEGVGTYMAGATVWLRYNLVQPGFRFVPYVQAGAGLTLTDIDRGIVGQDFNFNLNLGAGVRYFVTRDWSLNLEYRYQHVSNADLGDRNIGLNAHGPILGVSYFF